MLHLDMVGNMNTYLKTLKMKTVWEQKKTSGDITAKRDPSVDAWQKIVDDMHGIGEEGSTNKVKLQEIHAKLQAGSQLTQQERDYLKAKDPEAYQELIQEEREQRAYEAALRRCRTKEEAERLKVNQLNQSMMTIKSIETNPNISLAKKLEIAMREQRKVNNVLESTQKFVESGTYEKLPTEAEYLEELKESAEQQSLTPEQEPNQESETEDVPAETADAAVSDQGSQRAELSSQPSTQHAPTSDDLEALGCGSSAAATHDQLLARAKATYAAASEEGGRHSSWTKRA